MESNKEMSVKKAIALAVVAIALFTIFFSVGEMIGLNVGIILVFYWYYSNVLKSDWTKVLNMTFGGIVGILLSNFTEIANRFINPYGSIIFFLVLGVFVTCFLLGKYTLVFNTATTFTLSMFSFVKVMGLGDIEILPEIVAIYAVLGCCIWGVGYMKHATI